MYILWPQLRFAQNYQPEGSERARERGIFRQSEDLSSLSDGALNVWRLFTLRISRSYRPKSARVVCRSRKTTQLDRSVRVLWRQLRSDRRLVPLSPIGSSRFIMAPAMIIRRRYIDEQRDISRADSSHTNTRRVCVRFCGRHVAQQQYNSGNLRLLSRRLLPIFRSR